MYPIYAVSAINRQIRSRRDKGSFYFLSTIRGGIAPAFADIFPSGKTISFRSHIRGFTYADIIASLMNAMQYNINFFAFLRYIFTENFQSVIFKHGSTGDRNFCRFISRMNAAETNILCNHAARHIHFTGVINATAISAISLCTGFVHNNLTTGHSKGAIVTDATAVISAGSFIFPDKTIIHRKSGAASHTDTAAAKAAFTPRPIRIMTCSLTEFNGSSIHDQRS